MSKIISEGLTDDRIYRFCVIPLLPMKNLEAKEFLTLSESYPIVDVRSPLEFQKGHIPGAYNIPLFTDQERAEVGTLYKKVGRDMAFEKALDYVGPKMSSFVKSCRDLSPQDYRLIHCWRGGMRSSSFAWLMSSAGMTCSILDGGYKSYRSFLRNELNQPIQLVIISGSTGTGKTEILRKLAELGEQVIDLEALAVHKGSVFGGLMMRDQPTTEQFQNNLLQAVNPLDKTTRVWVEDESIGIGEVHIPDEFWVQMTKSPIIKIELDKQVRVDRLVTEYGLSSIGDIEDCVTKITRRLGGLNTQIALEKLKEGDLHSTADTLLQYYDKAYQNSLDRKSRKIRGSLNYLSFDAQTMANDLIHMADQLEKTEPVNG